MNVWMILLVAAEVVAIVAIIHLWIRRQMRWGTKLFWTVFLLIPFLGLLFYEFLTNDPEPHGEEPTGGPYV